MERVRRFGTLPVLVVIAAVANAACGGETGFPAASALPSPRIAGIVTQTSSDCSVSQSSDKITAGAVAFTFVNASGNKAGLDVWRMPQPSSFDELVAAAKEDRRRAESGQPPQGDHLALGTAPAIRAEWDIAASRTVSGRLEAGSYALVCIATYAQVSEPRLLAVLGPIQVEPA
jgi:hypothetical protein